MTTTAGALATVALSAALLAAACDDSSSGDTTSGSGGGQATAGWGEGGCSTCVRDACSSEVATCKADAGCASWLRCLEACPIAEGGDADPTCEATCPVDGTVAAEGRDAIVTCRRSGAGQACAECGIGTTTSTGTGGSGPALCTMPAAVDQTCQVAGTDMPCEACIQEECCDSYRAVFGSGPTADLAQCWLACPDDDGDCANGCYADYPDGVQGFGDYRACTEVNCEATGKCPSQHDTECLTCQRTECTCELAACHADVECHTTVECLSNCPALDTGCGKACVDAHPNGAGVFELLGVCSSQNCVDHCATN